MPELALLRWEVLFHWAAALLYALSFASFVYGVNFDRGKALEAGVLLALIGLLPHSAALAVRWAAAGHGPYMTRGEVLSSNAWVGMLMFLVLARRVPRLKAAGLAVVPLCLLMVGAAVFVSPGIKNLPPSLRSFWLVLHVAFAKLGAGGLLLAVGAATLYLLKEGRTPKGWLARLPSLEEIDAFAGRFAGFGFAFWSVMIAAGAIWAGQSWGRYWAWDPIETWSLVTWLLFGIHLHLRRLLGWRGRKSAWTLGACFLASVFTILAVPFVAGSLHTEYFR